MAKPRTITIKLDGIGEDLYRDLVLSVWMQTQTTATGANFKFEVTPDNGDGYTDHSFGRALDKLWERYGRETRFDR